MSLKSLKLEKEDLKALVTQFQKLNVSKILCWTFKKDNEKSLKKFHIAKNHLDNKYCLSEKSKKKDINKLKEDNNS